MLYFKAKMHQFDFGWGSATGIARNLIGGVYVLTRSLQFQNMC